MAWFKTRKGRGYGKYDNKSHGTPHAMNSPEFWAVRRSSWRAMAWSTPASMPAPSDAAEREAQARHNFGVAMGVLRAASDVVDRVSDRLVEVAGTVPDRVDGFNLGGRGAEIFDDPRFTDVKAYPAAMWKQPGEKAPNRAALAAWGLGQRHRPRRVRPPAGDRVQRGPGRVDQHRGLRQGLGGPPRLGLVQPRHQPARHAAAAGDHRVHERRRQRGHRHREHGR